MTENGSCKAKVDIKGSYGVFQVTLYIYIYIYVSTLSVNVIVIGYGIGNMSSSLWPSCWHFLLC